METLRDILRSRAFAVGTTQSMIWVVLGSAVLRSVNQFEKIFQDFGAKLPVMTIVLVKFAHFLGGRWYLVFLTAMVWPLVNWGVVSNLSPSPEVVLPKRIWYFITWAVILLVVPFVAYALFQPLIELINHLSATPAAPGNSPR